VWSNSTGLVETGSNLITGWSNHPSYVFETLTVSGANVTSGINSSGYGIAYHGISLTVGKLYKLSYTFTLNSGTAPQIGTAPANYTYGASFNATATAGANSAVFEATALDLFVLIRNETGQSSNFSFTSMELIEVVPGITSGTLGPDGGWNIGYGGTRPEVTRQHKDATFTKAGSFYSYKHKSKETDAGSSLFWSVFAGKGAEKFYGRTIAFGAWIYHSGVADTGYLRISQYDGSSWTNTDSTTKHTGSAGWEWIEMTLTLGNAVAQNAIYFKINGTRLNETYYFSQPMLVFGSSIGSGNYTRPQGEIVVCDKLIRPISNVSPAAADDKILGMEVLSNGKIPKGAKGFNMRVICLNSSITNGQGISFGRDSNYQYALECNPIVNNIYQTASGFVTADANGDIYQQVTEAGATLSSLYMDINAVYLT
jgi:hypothetical protein